MSRSFRLLAAGFTLITAFVCAAPSLADASGRTPSKLDSTLAERSAQNAANTSRVIVRFKRGWDASSDVRRLGARLGRRLKLIDGVAVELPNGLLKKVAEHPAVESIHWDREIVSLPRSSPQSAQAVAGLFENFGYTGAGVGVAIVDSGIAPWHDDLTYEGSSPLVKVTGGQRIAAFHDFVNGFTTPYDDYGHGTHVAGIIAGNGHDSGGAIKGAAPEAHLIILKVLDASGKGQISDAIAALDFAVANRAAYNIRVVNLSIAAAVLESYMTDPLTLAAKRAVDTGIVVVAAAGNLGRDAQGQTQYGGITAPANAPWVVTVGAYDHQGTAARHDDIVAPYSSRGPTAVDFAAKPDLLAPGSGITSLSDSASKFYLTKGAQLVDTGIGAASQPYLSLTGTSVAAPAVTGTIALMMQANPLLTPNLAKAVLEYTASFDPDYDALTQGAGFLDTRGAVRLAQYFATARAGDPYPSARTWTRKIIWGNQWIGGGAISPSANAWSVGVTWGAECVDGVCDNALWGAQCETDGCDNIVWGTMCETENCDNIVWGTSCEGGDCGDNIVWGTTDNDGDNIVWGTHCADEACDNIVWGTDENSDNIVWGTDCGGEDCGDNIVWGTSCHDGDCGDNIVWGTNCDTENCDNVVWGTSDDDGDNIVWGTRTSKTSAPGLATKTTGKR